MLFKDHFNISCPANMHPFKLNTQKTLEKGVKYLKS